jgi:circadian clock protein KaiC
MTAPRPLPRLSTGKDALDQVMGGGVPVGSTVVVAGEPGTGKTVFTLQMMFALARQGRRCLYITTLSEPSLKVIRFMQQFTFFDADLLERRISLFDVGSVARSHGVAEALARVRDRVEGGTPDLVAIDSSRALHDLVGDPAHARIVLYDLAVSVAGWGVTTLLVGEYLRNEYGRFPEFAIADGAVLLTNDPLELTTVRHLEVLKLRGTGYVSGRHFFEVTGDGFAFYPRVRAPEIDSSLTVSTDERLTTGVPGLDDLFGGGLPRRTTTIVQGATGTGKTLLGLHFLLEGARRGEPGILCMLEETPDQLRGIAAKFGWDLATLEGQGRLVLQYTSPVELSTDRFLNAVRHEVERVGARRIVFDSLTSLVVSVPSHRRFQELVFALTKHLRATDTTTWMTVETPGLLSSAEVSSHGVSPAADNLISLRYVEIQGRLDRALAVIKARGVNTQTELRQLIIGNHGARIGPGFTGLRGVLTGIPEPEPAVRRKSARGLS